MPRGRRPPPRHQLWGCSRLESIRVTLGDSIPTFPTDSMIKLEKWCRIGLLIILAQTIGVPSQANETNVPAQTKVPARVASLLANQPAGTTCGLVVISDDGEKLFHQDSDLELPTASAVKPLLLLELFSKFEDELETANRPDIARIVHAKRHPAIIHFSQEDQKSIADALVGVSIKELGKIMIDSEDLAGNETSNVVYNAAANVAISLLGGPGRATDSIHARHQAFRSVQVRRYMLARRDVRGDNTASPSALASLYQLAIGKAVEGLKASTVTQIAEILRKGDEGQYGKNGTLTSDPVTSVRTGQYLQAGRRLNYAVMASQKRDTKQSSLAQYESLKQLTTEIVVRLREATQPDVATLEVDWLLTNGEVHLGNGETIDGGDVAILDDRIVAVGDFKVAKAKQTLDCTGLVICPGFIDLHNHSDTSILNSSTRSAMCYLMQGCTSIVTGNCGSGPIDVRSYYARIDELGCGPNVMHLVPQGALRDTVIGSDRRAATSEDLLRMQALTAKAMRDGAWGMSSGLIYVPSSFASTEELGAIAKVVGRHGGIYASHIRNEGLQLLEAVEEALEIGRLGELPVHISHFKSSGKDSWGLVRTAVATINQRRAAGQIVTADQYPYTASNTSLRATLVPSWARAGTRKDMLERLQPDHPDSDRALEAIKKKLVLTDNGHRIQIATYTAKPDWAGRRLDDLANEAGMSTLEVAIQIMGTGASVVNHGIDEMDVRFVMQQPWVATASDGSSKIPGPTVPHPRSYGTFPRKVGHYSIREGVIPLGDAIRSSTGLPASILGLQDRGLLKQSQYADVIVFDKARFIDRATFEKPHQFGQGLVYVFVNGQPAVFNGMATGVLNGRPLRKH